MNYREKNPSVLANFFAEWNHYAAINSLAERPASERFQAFRAAMTFAEPYTGHTQSVVPPEYAMLLDWLAAESSGYWEPVSDHP